MKTNEIRLVDCTNTNTMTSLGKILIKVAHWFIYLKVKLCKSRTGFMLQFNADTSNNKRSKKRKHRNNCRK